jgi:hypothetical protein
MRALALGAYKLAFFGFIWVLGRVSSGRIRQESALAHGGRAEAAPQYDIS